MRSLALFLKLQPFMLQTEADGRGTVSSVQVRCLRGKGAHICVPGQAYGGQQPAIGCGLIGQQGQSELVEKPC